MTTDHNDLVTIAQAAASLRISERQVRRYLPLLHVGDSAEDPQRTHRGKPVLLVRVAAIHALRKGQDNRQSSGQVNGHSTGATDGVTSKATGVAPPGSMDALLAEKDARITDLQERIRELGIAIENEREAHKRAELLHLNTQGELSALRDRAAQLEQLNTKLIEALPSGTTDGAADISGGIVTGKPTDTPSAEVPVDPYGNTATVTTGDTQERDRAGGRVETPPDTTEGKSRRWWSGIAELLPRGKR